MQLTEEALKEFEELWKKDHPGQHIQPKALLDMATKVLNSVKIFYEKEKLQ